MEENSSSSVHRPAAEEVLRELERILDSPAFQGSRRCCQFLDHVCRRTLAGEIDSLKERSLAIDVFGRHANSDLGDDTIVRVGAREVRKRLVQFYATPEGRATRVFIDLPAGAYVPEFRYAPPESEPLAAAVPAAPAARVWTRRRVVTGISAAAGAGALAAVGLWRQKTIARAPFERFWAPVFSSSEPLLIAVGHPIVYHASQRAQQLTDQRLGPQPLPGQRPIDVLPNQVDGTDIIPVLNQYVGFGDMMVTTEVSSMLARRGNTVRVRLANAVQFADLRESPTILVGAITNRWTNEMGKHWRFQFRRNTDRRHCIVDTAGTDVWLATAKEDGSTGEDYILISRVHDTATGGILLLAAGVKQFGTEAAGRVLTDPDLLSATLSPLGAGWESRNLQLVLVVKVIGNNPGQPTVVASHVW